MTGFQTFNWWECPECGRVGQVSPTIDVVVCSGGGKPDPVYPAGKWDIPVVPAHDPTRCVRVDPPRGKVGTLAATA